MPFKKQKYRYVRTRVYFYFNICFLLKLLFYLILQLSKTITRQTIDRTLLFQIF